MKERMDISAEGLDFIERWEYFVPYIYDDFHAPKHVDGKLVYDEYTGGPVDGTLTEGYGHTKAAAGHGKWEIGSRLDEGEARDILHQDLVPVINFINRVVKVDLSQGQFDALCSFTMNCGEGTLEHSSILRLLNRGNYDGARRAFDLYTRSKGKVMAGLQRRRDAEQVLWDERHAEIDLPVEPVHHVADVDVPPTKTMAKSTEGWTAIGQIGAGGGEAGHQTFDAYALADKAIEAKSKAEALGVEPIKLFDKLDATISILIHQPGFWVAVCIAIGGVYLWARRRWRLLGEV
jgi:lysozyme